MSKTLDAKVNIDLTPFRKGTVECDATLYVGILSYPDEIAIEISGLSADDFNEQIKTDFEVSTIFGNPRVTGSTANTNFETELAFIKDVEFSINSTLVHFCLGSYSESIPHEAQYQSWRFRLANFRLRNGDTYSHSPPPIEAVPPEQKDEYHTLIAEWQKRFEQPNLSLEQIEEKYKDFKLKGELHRNRIVFNFAGRQWYLDDNLHGRWTKYESKITQPIVSGMLSTKWIEGDTEEALQTIVTDITDLLTFALGRDVKWVSCGCYSENGQSNKVIYRNPELRAFNQSGFSNIDNWEHGNLRHFLETSSESFSANREWWSITVGLLNQAIGPSYSYSEEGLFMEIKFSLVNALLERIVSKVLDDNYGNEIDPKLNEGIERKWFRKALHWVFRCLSNNWEREHTDTICDVIKKWNDEPSFPEKIIRCCQILGIPEPSKKKLDLHHEIIQASEMDKLIKIKGEPFDYLLGIESDSFLFIIRMLGFDGFVFLRAFHFLGEYGKNHVRISKVSELLATMQHTDVEAV